MLKRERQSIGRETNTLAGCFFGGRRVIHSSERVESCLILPGAPYLDADRPQLRAVSQNILGEFREFFSQKGEATPRVSGVDFLTAELTSCEREKVCR